MYPNNIERVIKQFQEAVKTPECSDVIENLIRKAYSHKIDFVLSNDPSSCRDDRESAIRNNVEYTVKILSVPKSGNTREILYDMMHEMGHCFDPDKLLLNKSNEKERETRAWELADQEFDFHPKLVKFEQEYVAYRNMRKQKYLNKS